MVVRKQTIRFSADRTPIPKKVRIGYEGDHLAERLEFILPSMEEEQSAFLMIGGRLADAVQLEQDANGQWGLDLTANIVGDQGTAEAYVRIETTDGRTWHSGVLTLTTQELPDVETEIERQHPTAVGQMLAAIAQHSAAMDAQGADVQEAASAAQSARDGATAAASAATAAAQSASAYVDEARKDAESAAGDAGAAQTAASSASTSAESAQRRAEDVERMFVMLSPPFEESGAVVVCHPAAGSALGVVSGIEAVQAGTGDPSPENVRAISGHAGVVLTKTGKNLLDTSVWQSVTAYGITFTNHGDGSIHVFGTNSLAYVSNHPVSASVKVRAGSYTVSGGDGQNAYTVVRYVKNGKITYLNGNGSFTTEACELHVYMQVKASAAADVTLKPMIEVGSVATEYEVYRGTEYAAQFGQTVYGGTYDWQSGVLTVTHRMVTVSPTTHLVEGKTYGCIIKLPDARKSASAKENDVILAADRLKITGFNPIYAKSEQFAVAGLFDVAGIAIRTNAEMDNNQEAIRAWLAANPVTVVYKLAEPYEVQLGGTVITAAEDENVLMSSTGNTTVSGRSDPVWVIGNLTARVAALEAAVVNGN